MRKRSRVLAVAVALAGASAVLAASPHLRVDLQVHREVATVEPSGETSVRHEPVDAAEAGDVLVYSLEIVNEGPTPALNARVLDPIPTGTVLIPDSVTGDGAEVSYSIDGGASFGAFPITRRTIANDGREREVPVGIEEYTHVRWTLMEPLAPGQMRTAQFKVRVE